MADPDHWQIWYDRRPAHPIPRHNLAVIHEYHILLKNMQSNDRAFLDNFG